METVLVSWSGGKDSCLALYELMKSREYHVAALLTTVTTALNPGSMNSRINPAVSRSHTG